MDQSLAEKSYQYIRDQLSRGEMTPGERLVNRSLAAKIGVSVIPVREAIHRLASEGLVEHVPGAGAFVRKPTRQSLDNLYVLRDALESCAAAEAARYISVSELHALDELLERFKQTAAEIRQNNKPHSTKRQLNRWLDDETDFHELLVEASRNEVLAKVIRDNLAIVNVFEAQRSDPGLLTYEVAAETCQSKSQLIDALRDRDADLARKLMSDSIQRGRHVVLDFLSQKGRAN
ncbi:GntR family transcriptional regulator [Neorhodopirellula pilleata]|nr:GntR family transcriptional regulator [Neorhodopirellula pilleata]